MSEEENIRRRERQLRYEVEAVDRGIKRYREYVRQTDTADTSSGISLIQLILDALIPAVRGAQEEALEEMTNRKSAGGGGGRGVIWWYPMLCLDAERIAYIAARTAISWGRRSSSDQPALSWIAKQIAERIRQERNFLLWKEAQRGGEGPINMAKLMLSYVKTIDPRTVAKWMKKGETFDKVEWTVEEKLHFGSKLVHLLVENGGGCFTVEVRPKLGGRYKTEHRVELTQLARDYINSRQGAEELTRPWLLPMLCPPNDWRPVEKG